MLTLGCDAQTRSVEEVRRVCATPSKALKIPTNIIVVFDIGRGNDVDRGIAEQSAGNTAAIEQAIRSRGAIPVYAPYGRIIGSEQANPAAWRTNDLHHRRG
jgi:hypothetical protein